MINQSIKTYLKLFLFLLITSLSYGQNSKVSKIQFNLTHSLRASNHYVSISFEKNGEQVTANVKSKPRHSSMDDVPKLDYTKEVITEDFQKLIVAVKKIESTDILFASEILGNDGTTCKITFGNYSADISYTIWTPDYKTKNRKLTDFLNACKLIIKTVGLNPKKIL